MILWGKSLKRSKIAKLSFNCGIKMCFGNVHQTLARKRKELAKAEAVSMARSGHDRLQALLDVIKKKSHGFGGVHVESTI